MICRGEREKERREVRRCMEKIAKVFAGYRKGQDRGGKLQVLGIKVRGCEQVSGRKLGR